jgi:hypothetical protein
MHSSAASWGAIVDHTHTHIHIHMHILIHIHTYTYCIHIHIHTTYIHIHTHTYYTHTHSHTYMNTDSSAAPWAADLDHAVLGPLKSRGGEAPGLFEEVVMVHKVNACACMHSCVCVCACLCVCVCLRPYTHKYIRSYIIHTYIHTYIHTAQQDSPSRRCCAIRSRGNSRHYQVRSSALNFPRERQRSVLVYVLVCVSTMLCSESAKIQYLFSFLLTVLSSVRHSQYESSAVNFPRVRQLSVVCMHIYVHKDTYIGLDLVHAPWVVRMLCIYTYIRTYIDTHCIHTHHIHTYIHTQRSILSATLWECACVCIHTYIHTYTNTHIHTYTALDLVPDTPEVRMRGWQRISLFALFFQPGGLDIIPWGQAFPVRIYACVRACMCIYFCVCVCMPCIHTHMCVRMLFTHIFVCLDLCMYVCTCVCMCVCMNFGRLRRTLVRVTKTSWRP